MRKLKLLLAACLVTVAASASKTVYLAPSEGWTADGARFALYHFTGETAGPWVDFTDADADGIFEATFDDTYEGMIICRMNGATTENNWDNKWNQTSDLAAPGADALLYTISGDTGSPTVTVSIYGATAASFTDGGKYLFKNVGSGRYLGPGNSWGTQASLLAQSHYNTLHAASGKYTIESQVSNGGTNYYFTGSFMDGGATNIDIVQLTNGNYVMSTTGTAFFGYDGTSTVLATLADYAADNAQWQIISYDEALADATEENPVDATFMILDQNFDRNNRHSNKENNDLGSAWTVESSNCNLSGGDNTNRVAESWRAAFTLSQTITVPNGYYKIRAQAAVTEYTVTGENLPVVYANDATVPFNICTNGNNGMDQFSANFTAGQFFTEWTDMVTVTGKSITVGVKGTRTDSWCVWDNIQLMYYGPINLSGYVTALADAVAAAEATEGTIPTAAYNAIAAVVTENNKEYDNEDDYLTAINAINTAVSTYAYDNIVAAYARYNRIKAAVLAINADIDVTAADAAAEAATTNTEVDAAVPTLRAALTAYLATVEDQEIDITDAMIDNPAPGTAEKLDYWTNEGGTPGLQYNLYEFYKVEATTKQQLAPLPAGYYKMTVVGYTREGNGAYMFADGNTHNLVQVASSVVNVRQQGDAWIAAGNGVNEFIFQLENDEPDLEIGIYTSATENNDKWTCWRSFKLEYMGTAPLTVFQSELAEKAAEANAHATELGETIPAGAMTAYTSAISTATAANATVAECKQSIDDIAAATTAADAFVTPYAAYLAVQPHVQALYDAEYEELTAGSHETLGNALTAATTSLAATTIATTDIAGIASTLKAAGVTYAGAANPINDAQFDLTFMLTNPDVTAFTNWNKVEGWYTDQSDGNSQKMTNDAATSEDGTKTAFYEYWSYTAKSNNAFTLYQKVTLPEGTYNISCYAFAKEQDDPANTGDKRGVKFYANDTEGSAVYTTRLTQASIEFVNASEQEVKIGLKATSPNSYNWMGIGYVELYKVPAKSYTVDESVAWDNTVSGAGEVTLTRTIKEGVNTLVLPFSMTQAEVEANFGEGSKVYAISAYDAAKENLSFTLKSGISANEPCLLKATVAGTSYTLADRTIVAGEPEATATGAKMIGTYAATMDAPDGSYIISDGKIYNVNSTVTLKNTRAYIQLTTEGARALTFSLDGGETTGIATLENGELKVETGAIYDLSGRVVKNPAKGIYILNGKKVIK